MSLVDSSMGGAVVLQRRGRGATRRVSRRGRPMVPRSAPRPPRTSGRRSAAARTARTSDSGGKPSGPGPATGTRSRSFAPIVRAACTIWASCGRCSGRSTITPSTRPSPSADRTWAGVRRSRRNTPCVPSPYVDTGPPTSTPPPDAVASVTSIAAIGAPSVSVNTSVRRVGSPGSIIAASATGISSVTGTGQSVPSVRWPAVAQ